MLREVLLSVGYSGSTHMYIGQQRVNKPQGELMDPNAPQPTAPQPTATQPTATHSNAPHPTALGHMSVNAGQTAVNLNQMLTNAEDEAILADLDAQMLARARELHHHSYALGMGSE